MKTHQSTPKWEDILFENKNKMYGAYELRTHYEDRLVRSFFITISSGLLLFILSYFLFVKHVTVANIPSMKDSIMFITDVITIQEEFKKPEATFPPSRPTPVEQAYIPVDTVINEVIDTTPVASNPSPGPVGTSTDTTSSSGPAGPPTGMPTITNEVRNIVSVDTQPAFPGGIEKFYKYLKSRIRFTNNIEGGFQARIYVSFVINEEGLVSDIIFKNKAGFGLDEQVAEILSASPKWSPGIYQNKPVKTQLVLPVNFNLIK